MLCIVCQSDLPEGALFCGECGSAVTATQQMAAVIEPGSVAEAVAKSRAAREKERASDRENRPAGEHEKAAEGDLEKGLEKDLETRIVPRIDDEDLVALFGEPAGEPVEAPRFADEVAVEMTARQESPAETGVVSGAETGPQRFTDTDELASLANFTVTLESGESVIVHENALLGRMPQPAEGEYFEHLIVVVDPSRSVSKTHLELGIDGTSIWISDRNSGNGSIVREPGVVPRRAQPGTRYEIVRGTRIDIGDQHIFID